MTLQSEIALANNRGSTDSSSSTGSSSSSPCGRPLHHPLPHVACSNSWPIALAAQLKFTAACHCYPASTWQIKNFNFNMPPTFSSVHTARLRTPDSYGRQSSEAKCSSLMRSLGGETELEIYDFYELNCDPGSDNDKSICNMHNV